MTELRPGKRGRRPRATRRSGRPRSRRPKRDVPRRAMDPGATDVGPRPRAMGGPIPTCANSLQHRRFSRGSAAIGRVCAFADLLTLVSIPGLPTRRRRAHGETLRRWRHDADPDSRDGRGRRRWVRGPHQRNLSMVSCAVDLTWRRCPRASSSRTNERRRPCAGRPWSRPLTTQGESREPDLGRFIDLRLRGGVGHSRRALVPSTLTSPTLRPPTWRPAGNRA